MNSPRRSRGTILGHLYLVSDAPSFHPGVTKVHSSPPNIFEVAKRITSLKGKGVTCSDLLARLEGIPKYFSI